jgi:small subunit ribosomal protein S8
MAMTDPIGDMLTRIRNAQMRRKRLVVSAGKSKLRERVLHVLADEGYIRGYTHELGDGKSEFKSS